MTPADLAAVFSSGKFGNGYPIENFVFAANNVGDGYNCIYIGIAPQGSATSDPAWIVKKLTYDSNDNITQTRISPKNSIFDNYATLVYT